MTPYKTRENFFLAILAFYFIPLATLFFYYIRNENSNAWLLLGTSLFVLSLGSLFLYLLLQQREEAFNTEFSALNLPNVSRSSTDENSSQQLSYTEIQSLQTELEENQRYAQSLEEEILEKEQSALEWTTLKEKYEDQVALLQRELYRFKESSEEKLEQNQIFLREHQQTIAEQRHALELKQQHVQQLEDKVRDLTYEIKTLLNLAEKTAHEAPITTTMHEPFFNNDKETSYLSQELLEHPTEESALRQLKRCIEIAEKMIGASHYSKHSRMQNLSINHEALDLRRLFESLRNENSCTILLYSQKDHKLIFINDQIKNFLGWTNDKFIQNFPYFIEPSLETWQNGLSQLAYKNESAFDLSIKAKDGSFVFTKCHLGLLTTGLFRGYVLGVLYQEAQSLSEIREG